MPSDLLAFLTADGRDSAGRTFDEVVSLDDQGLERNHDFIQWLFPLTEPSQAVPGSPVLDASAVAALRASPVVQARLAKASARMLDFYAATDRWRRAYDHNHLRITRIIRSLRLLVGEDQADAFKAVILSRVEATRAPVSARSRGYWATA